MRYPEGNRLEFGGIGKYFFLCRLQCLYILNILKTPTFYLLKPKNIESLSLLVMGFQKMYVIKPIANREENLHIVF